MRCRPMNKMVTWPADLADTQRAADRSPPADNNLQGCTVCMNSLPRTRFLMKDLQFACATLV